VMLFSWMVTDHYFRELSDLDTRKEIYEERIRMLEENMTPFGYIQDGAEFENFSDDEGQVWQVVENSL